MEGVNIEYNQLWEKIYSIEGVAVFDATLFPKFIMIDLLLIIPSKRNQLIGSLVMSLICDFADKFKLPILLMPDDSFGTPLDILKHFYLKYNFTPVKDCSYLTDNFYKGDEYWIRRGKKGKRRVSV